jgi:predicted aspartyl protease
VKIRLAGRIVESEPRLSSRIVRKCLQLNERSRDYFVLDSGFTGSVAVPDEWADRLDLRYAGIQTFSLANGQIVEFPTYLGIVRIGRAEGLFEVVVTGEALLGMEFLQRLNARVILDCPMGTLSLIGTLAAPDPGKSKLSKSDG